MVCWLPTSSCAQLHSLYTPHKAEQQWCAWLLLTILKPWVCAPTLSLSSCTPRRSPPPPPSMLFSAVTAWLQDLEAGPIKSFSFSKVPPSQPASPGSSETDLFSAPDFVLGSTTGNIVAVNCHTFEHPSSDQPSHRLLAQVLATIFMTLLQPQTLLFTPAILLWLPLISSGKFSVQYAEPSGCCHL